MFHLFAPLTLYLHLGHICPEALGAGGHSALFVVAGLDLQRFVELCRQSSEPAALFIMVGAGRGVFGSYMKLRLVVLVQQHRLGGDSIIDQEVILREAGTDMPRKSKRGSAEYSVL